MKKIFGYIAIVTIGAVLFASCVKDNSTDGGYQRPAVRDYTPITNATTAVNIDTEVELKGVNLNNVKSIIVGGVEAQITAKKFESLKFKVPMSPDFTQGEINATTITVVSGIDKGESFSWRKDYFVYVSPTDAIVKAPTSPLSGTIGDVITLSGYNLDLVASISIGTTVIPKSEFTGQTATEIKFKIPTGAYTPGDDTRELSFIWGEANKKSVVTADFTIKTPIPDSYTFSGSALPPGQTIKLTGVNMDLYNTVTVDNLAATIGSKTATEINIIIPDGAYLETAVDGVVTVDIKAGYGDPSQISTVATGVKVDLNVAIAVPTFTSVVPADGGTSEPYKFYLKKEVVVTGTNLTSVGKVTIDGLDAPITAKTATSLTFTMPEDFTFATMTPKDIIATYGSTDVNIVTGAKIYPFYYWKDVKLGSQNYDGGISDNLGSNGFFSLEEGKIISVKDFAANRFDANAYDFTYVLQGAETTPPTPWPSSLTMTAANTINKTNVTSAKYYSVKPYIFSSVSSAAKFAFQVPSNSHSQLKNMKFFDGSTQNMIADFSVGTPVIQFKSITSGTIFDNVSNGSIESLETTTKATTSAPEIKTTSAGDVYHIQWFSYQLPSNPSGGTIDHVLKNGYIKITDIQTSSGTIVNADNLLSVTFDCYWPKNDRAGIAR